MYWKGDAAFDIKGILTRKLAMSVQNLSHIWSGWRVGVGLVWVDNFKTRSENTLVLIERIMKLCGTVWNFVELCELLELRGTS
jgi:hypothetical protein